MLSFVADNLRLCASVFAGLLIVVGVAQRDEAKEQPTGVALVSEFEAAVAEGPRYLPEPAAVAVVDADESLQTPNELSVDEVIESGDTAARNVAGVQFRICRVTAYCDRGTTAAGTQSGVGQCAAPADIPFGTRVYIAKLDRTFVVTDRTHRRFRDNTVDLFMPTRDVCLDFGRKFLECEFRFPVDEWDRPASPEDRSWAEAYPKALAMTGE